MGESKDHQQLVEILVEYVKDSVGVDLCCFIQSDASDEYTISPQTDEGFRPDVFFEYNGRLIIGEAKTENDISRRHSIEQYYSYLKKCAQYHGKAEYVMAVPWMGQAEANNIIKKISKEFPGDYEIKVLKGVL